MARTSTERKIDDMADKGKDMAQRGARSARASIDKARNYARESVNEGESTLEDMMETGGRMINDFKHKSAETYEEGRAYAEDAIHNRPFIALAGAFVAGAVLARIFGSR